MIRIVIADDHTIMREGLKQLLAPAADLSVVGEAEDGNQVLKTVRERDFDVLLLDMSMPGKSGIELIKQVRSTKPKLKILVLSMHEETQYAVRALKAGASGYMTKDCASAELVTAIRKIAAGGAYISSAAAELLALGAMTQSNDLPHTSLSDREYQVFDLLVAGQTVTDIADRLNLSVKTISTHKANVMRKMNMSNQSELVRYALNHRLLANPDAH